MKNEKNKYLEFCMKNQVTTEHFNKKDSEEYTRKRRNLYRQLGIPIRAIRDAKILEIGPGVGHNTLPLLCDWNCKSVDLVEPNSVAVNELIRVFDEMQVDKGRYRIFPTTLEEFKEDKTYDIVIAEGYIQYAHNWKELMGHIKRSTHKDSIVIVTCMDEFSIYVEMVKRLVGQRMVRDIEGDLSDKVAFLAKEWEGAFKCLPGMTRTSEEWLLDWVFNEGILCDDPMTIKNAIEEMQDDHEVLGCSQNIFVDYSWYKDLEFDHIESYKKQYDMKKHMFLTTGRHEESVHDPGTNEKLGAAIKVVLDLIRRSEKDKSCMLSDIYRAIDDVTGSTDDQKIKDFNEDAKSILKAVDAGERSQPEKYDAWNATFGRSMQYISFQKR